MPKSRNGILLKCEKTIKIFIKQLNIGRDFIIMDIDENHLFINEKYLNFVKDEVYKMQDKNAYNKIEIFD